MSYREDHIFEFQNRHDDKEEANSDFTSSSKKCGLAMGTNRLKLDTGLLFVLLLAARWGNEVVDGFVAVPQRNLHQRSCSGSLRSLSASFSADSDKENDPREGIPQLPATGSSSKKQEPSDTDVNGNKPFVASKKFQLQYTCNVCETRNSHYVSRIAYRNGVVIVRCKGCDSQHLIADNLGWTDYDGGFQGETNTIEDYFAASSDGNTTVSRVSEEVFQLEKILQEHNTKSGSIVGEDGELALE